MATVTGKLLDFGLASINGKQPTLTFQANKPAISSVGTMLVTDPISVTPSSNGEFTVTLAATEDLMTDGVYYRVEAEWLAPDLNYVRADFPDWQLFVPTGGGTMSDLLKSPANRTLVIKSPTDPGPGFGPGTMWLQIDPADPDNPLNPANTGDLYEMRNA